MKPIVTTEAANDDLMQSLQYYAARSMKAARGFDAAYETALKRIRKSPRSFPITSGERRGCLLDKYPFRIIFSDQGDRIIIIAVAHAKRRDYWCRRS